MSKTMQQVQLIQGQRQLTTWVDKRNDVKVGTILSLKGEEGRWRVYRVFEVEMLESQLNTHRIFDNNNYDKHEGLQKYGPTR
jgi:hypothetical protein